MSYLIWSYEPYFVGICAVYIGQAPFFYVVKQKYTTANIVIYSDISFFYYQKMVYITTMYFKKLLSFVYLGGVELFKFTVVI